jgi:phosphatidylinositol alpha-mannosyltransferase
MAGLMRILQVCPYSWDAEGGVKTHVAELAGHLGQLGHEVLVAAPARAHPPEPRLRIVGRPWPVRFNGSTAWVCLSLQSTARLRAIMQEFRPDVVQVHEPLSPGVAMSATMVADSPVVATFHANYPRSLAAALYTLEARVCAAVWRRIDLCLAVSRAAAASIESRIPRRVRVIPNGVDRAVFDEAPPNGRGPRRRLLFVGRLERRKGFGTAVQAFALLAARFADLDLVAVGDGADRSVPDRLPAGIRGRVVMRGALGRAAVPGEYRAADVFVAPALGSESFGIVLLEAMSVGVPVVASDISGYREVVRNGVDGLLVPPGDAKAVAEAVERILAEPGLAARLRASAMRRVLEFSWETVAKRVEAAYAEAIDGRPLGPVRRARASGRRLFRAAGAAPPR